MDTDPLSNAANPDLEDRAHRLLLTVKLEAVEAFLATALPNLPVTQRLREFEQARLEFYLAAISDQDPALATELARILAKLRRARK